MAHQVLVQRLAFQPVDPDNPTVQAGPEDIVERGGLVPSYVSEFIISALSSAGVIVPVADKPDPTIIPISQEPALPLPNPEQPPPPGTGQVIPAPQQMSKPKVTDSKDAWEDYASSPAVGMDRAEAESLNKAKLITEVNRREDEKAREIEPAPAGDPQV